MVKLPTISSINLKGRTVMLRSDLNSDVSKGKIIPSERIKEAAHTIQILKKKGAKIVIIAHQGNPGKKDFISLKEHAKYLNKYTKITFVPDTVGKRAQEAIKSLKPKQAILLENIRFEKAEFQEPTKNNPIIKTFKPLIDLYINDAFSVSHRSHVSISGFPRYIKSSAGPLLAREVLALEKIHLKKSLYILGGGKPQANVKLLKKGRNIIATGYFGQMILIAGGKNLGYQNDYLKKDALVKGSYNTFLKKLKKWSGKVKTPIDFALNINGKRVEKNLKDFPQRYQIDDIGQRSIDLFKGEIKKARSIYMKGPAGYSTNKNFAKGTNELLRAIARSRAYSVIGGGHLSDALKQARISKKKFSYVSLSGGALLNYLAGEKLPGLKALGYYK